MCPPGVRNEMGIKLFEIDGLTPVGDRLGLEIGCIFVCNEGVASRGIYDRDAFLIPCFSLFLAPCFVPDFLVLNFSEFEATLLLNV